MSQLALRERTRIQNDRRKREMPGIWKKIYKSLQSYQTKNAFCVNEGALNATGLRRVRHSRNTELVEMTAVQRPTSEMFTVFHSSFMRIGLVRRLFMCLLWNIYYVKLEAIVCLVILVLSTVEHGLTSLLKFPRIKATVKSIFQLFSNGL